MAYRDQLYPWCIIRSLVGFNSPDPNPLASNFIVVARCRRRSDAEAQLKLLQQKTPQGTFTITFNKIDDLEELGSQSGLPSSSQSAADQSLPII